MGDGTKQVRVDNWGIFFLQRLQMFFSKTDYCDMTLQFEGNVQLKVHRLVMNACTEYFQFLEQTCTLEDNIIMMPSDLQADVIVPIVNFMYTGMLEFHLSIFDKLYKTAQIMNITILTKLLDAQKRSVSPAVRSLKKKQNDSPQVYTPVKKTILKQTPHHSDLPPPLPGRKIPVWKRKSIPTTPSPLSHSSFPPEPKWASPNVDPLSVPDNTPKPTRFEWPDDDLPTLSLMDTSFEEISYTSKPLLTQEEEQRATTSFDDLKHIPNNRSILSSKKRTSPNIDMEEVKNYGKELKIRSGLSHEDEIIEEVSDSGVKRKATEQKSKNVLKKVRFEEQQDSKTTTISIATDGKSSSSLDHERLVAEILKKYPQLVKKNKNIRLKIMAKGGKNSNEAVAKPTPKLKTIEIQKNPDPPKAPIQKSVESNSDKNKAPWVCSRCSTEEDPCEFVLYYLYRKHMTDVHNEKFDPKLCKYCGHKCSKQNLLMYHLYTKHGMKPPPGYNFPKCDQCPFIALSANILNKHKLRHGKNEIQCVECKLTFTSPTTLTSHIQITGHTGKSNKNNYDCQYCTKRYQSGVNLFSHVRLQHKNEAVRDGIVSIDEMDDMEDYDEEEASRDEYILPEIISDPEPSTKKVNIISDVKVVQDRSDHHTRQQPLTLEPSSEAEALNNVASGIATSLGLVDIVVLNDNQQLFIQPNQESYTNDQNEQPEFILPELTGRETFVQTQNEVITTDGVITQSMLSSNDIASTDELVMVLTDHDYGDNQEEISSENSNIVVLYSHPVDGQQDQFITSQGNLMVNSQGLLEIRNGATITSTASQVVMAPQETHIESIEMIQREIESHTDLKQETLYEEEKPVIEENQLKEAEVTEEEPPSDTNSNTNNKNESLIESLTQGEQLELTSPLVPLEESTNTQSKEIETIEETIEEAESTEKEETVPEKEKSPDPPQPPEEAEKEPELEATPLEQEEKEEVCLDDSFQEEEPIKEAQKPSDEPNDKEKEDSVEVKPTLPTEETEKEPELTDDSSKTDVMEIDEEKTTTSKEEISPEQSDTSTSQFNDENSQSSQENQQENVATKISILDDWEDTDSQQSGDKEKNKDADETVHKLMDDWEDEDEDDKKETDKQ